MIYFVLAVGAFWLFLTLATIHNMRAIVKLPTLRELPSTKNLPSVSIVIAARDEQQHIEQTVLGALAQEGIAHEVIVVDDRSTDETPKILDRLAAQNEQLRVLHIAELPAGWLGKCNACARGATLATGQWILFTDADTLLSPDVVARSVATAQRDQVDHIALWPSLDCPGLVGKGAILAWVETMVLYAPAAQINNDRGKKAVGIGAFNLVRMDAYRAIGGHEPLKMEVIDDMKLGLLLRRAGFRQRIYWAIGDVQTYWATSAWELILVVDKNWFAAVNYNLFSALAVMFLITGMWLAALAGPTLQPQWGAVALGGLMTSVVPAVMHTRICRWPWYAAIVAPLGFPMMVLAGIISTWKTIRQGGIRWRDTFYTLAELRQGLIR